MRLITFLNSTRQSRIGAMTPESRIVDLNSACALYLRDIENENAYQRLADALVPSNMRALFEGGDTSLEAARKAFDHAVEQESPNGASGEPIFFSLNEITQKAPIIPKKFFHTAGNFREHHEEASKAGFSHPVLPWIVFFQNTDAIIGHDEAVIYPEHLTQELDYELELAVVLKKAGKHFTPEEARVSHLQRHHCPRHSAPGNEVRRFQLLQGYRYLLPTGTLDRDRRRNYQSAQPGYGAAH